MTQKKLDWAGNFSKGNPCPICGSKKNEWCSFTKDGRRVCCRNFSDDVAGWRKREPPAGSTNNGMNYVIDGSTEPLKTGEIKPAAEKLSVEVVTGYAKHFQENANEGVLQYWARHLGVSADSLYRLGVGVVDGNWAMVHDMKYATDTLATPEMDGERNIVGIKLRKQDGYKCSIRGSSAGIYVPDQWNSGGPVLLVEGASDVAACLDLGYSVLGRPACTGGVLEFSKLLHGVAKSTPIIFLADNDENDAGIKGAKSSARELANYLGREIQVAIVRGVKDAREYLKEGDKLNSLYKIVETVGTAEIQETDDIVERVREKYKDDLLAAKSAAEMAEAAADKLRTSSEFPDTYVGKRARTTAVNKALKPTKELKKLEKRIAYEIDRDQKKHQRKLDKAKRVAEEKKRKSEVQATDNSAIVEMTKHGFTFDGRNLGTGSWQLVTVLTSPVKYELHVPEFQGFSGCPDRILLKSHELVSARAVALAVLEATKAIDLFEYQDTWVEIWNGRKAVPARGNTPAVPAITGLRTLLLAEREERNPRLDEDTVRDVAYHILERVANSTVLKNDDVFAGGAGVVFKDDHFRVPYGMLNKFNEPLREEFLLQLFKEVDFDLLKPGKGLVGIESSHFKVTEDDLRAICKIAKAELAEAERIFTDARRLSEARESAGLGEAES